MAKAKNVQMQGLLDRTQGLGVAFTIFVILGLLAGSGGLVALGLIGMAFSWPTYFVVKAIALSNNQIEK